jgi:hypothetical protein
MGLASGSWLEKKKQNKMISPFFFFLTYTALYTSLGKGYLGSKNGVVV